MWRNADVIKNAENFSAFFIGLLVLLLTSCAPQARYFNVDVRDKDAVDLPLDNRPVAVMSVVSQNKPDSLRVGYVAVGVAEKLEEDRGLESGNVAVYTIPRAEFDAAIGEQDNNAVSASVDTDYIQKLMINSGAHVFVFVKDLRFGHYGVQKMTYSGEYDNVNILVPYSVDLGVYDAISNKVLLKHNERDTVYLQVVASAIAEDKVGSILSGYLPQMSQKIGIKLGSYLSRQWETQERMLISYDGDIAWENAYALAQEFKWSEAVKVWMKLVESNNPKKSAYAAYNLAIGCEMMEQFDLAMKWIDYSLEKFRFREAIDLKTHLQKVSLQIKSN